MMIKNKANEYSLTQPTKEATAERRLREQAFIKGAEAVRSVLNQETQRLAGLLAKGTSDFEKGQLDGVFWLQSCIEELFEQ